MNTDHFKSRLEAEKTRLEHELAGVGKKNPAVPGEWDAVSSEPGSEPDLVDQAGSIASFENNEAILRDLEARYGAVQAALTKIQEGTYGICSVGGEKIEADRLEADPAATTCKAHLG
jgi:RNA polymerase-binding transcription factor DksA